VIEAEALVLRFFAEQDGDRLLFVNLGRELRVPSLAEPLVAPPLRRAWTTLWSSEDTRYGGGGIAPILTDAGWRIAAHSATLLGAGPAA